ncbi:hypothetical protein ACQ856_18380 [Mycolicibacterium psychrotolerans]|uniref:hypothetical protein n=1 Tax=Mycolicibacterium psychrotolerans TaxID=216929 RepID=UPI003D6697B8
MKTIKFKQDVPHEGLAVGDVLEVDDNSAAALIRRDLAEEYNPASAAEAGTNVVEVQSGAYGTQDSGVRTIDDIVDPQAARNRRVMSFTTVAQADPGPQAADVPTAADVDEAETPAVDGNADEVPTPAPDATPDSAPPATPDAATVTAAAKAAKRPGAKATATPTSPEQAAPDAQSAGGDAGGGSA